LKDVIVEVVENTVANQRLRGRCDGHQLPFAIQLRIIILTAGQGEQKKAGQKCPNPFFLMHLVVVL
jgi:hypothetical protein